MHILIKYINYGGRYIANFLYCVSQYKTSIKANKENKLKNYCKKQKKEQ